MAAALIFDCYGVIRIDSSLDPAVLDYIAALRPRYKIGLLSNTHKGALQQLFDAETLASHFDVAFTSGDIGVAKPQSAAYVTVAEALGVSPAECIMIDDTPQYCTAARQAGMEAVEYWSLEQLRRDLRSLGVNT